MAVGATRNTESTSVRKCRTEKCGCFNASTTRNGDRRKRQRPSRSVAMTPIGNSSSSLDPYHRDTRSSCAASRLGALGFWRHFARISPAIACCRRGSNTVRKFWSRMAGGVARHFRVKSACYRGCEVRTFVETDRSFHHCLAMIGRRELLQDLDAFVADEKTRVFFLVGPGEIGKSRLLYEWSREFAQRHKGWTLRFVSDSPGDFATALDATAKPLVLGFDDAHRLDDVRRALLAQLPAREDIKLDQHFAPGRLIRSSRN